MELKPDRTYELLLQHFEIVKHNIVEFDVFVLTGSYTKKLWLLQQIKIARYRYLYSCR